MSRFKRLFLFAIPLVFIPFLLSACGGGGSSSGGSGANKYAGTYTGSAQATVSVGSSASNTGTYPVRVVITNNGQVTLTDTEGTASGSLNGNQFTVSYLLPPIMQQGARCPATPVRYHGTISGTSINGTAIANNTCVIAANRIPLRIRGNFQVNKTSQVVDLPGANSAIRSAIVNSVSRN